MDRKPTNPASAPESGAVAGGWPQMVARVLLFAHLALSPLVFSAATVEVFEYNKVAILTITALLLTGGLLAVVAGRAVRGEPLSGEGESWATWAVRLSREPIALGFAVFSLSALVSTFISINVRTSVFGAHESFAGIVTMFAYLALFVATRELCRDSEHWRLLFFASVIGIAGSAIYGVMQLTALDPIRWGRTSGYGGITRVFATMGHPNFLSGFHATAFPLAAYFTVRAFRKGLYPLGLALALTAALNEAMIMISISRGAWVAFAAMLGVLTVGWVLVAKDRKGAFWIVGVNVAVFALTLAVLTTFPDGREVLKSIWSRFQNVFDTNAVTKESRSFIWAAAVQMWKDHPITGVGLDNFQLAFEQYRSVAYWHSEWNGTPTKAHNEALHILATQGTLGGIGMMLMVAGSAFAFWRALKSEAIEALRIDPAGRSRDPLDRSLLVAALAGVVGFVVQDFVSFTVAGCGTIFVTYAAYLSRVGGPAEPPAAPFSDYGRRVAPETAIMTIGLQVAIAIATFVAIKLMVLDPYAANSLCRSGAGNLQADRADVAVKELRQATEIDPSKELYWVRLGTACQMLARSLTDPATKRATLLEAKAAYERSIELVPINSYNWANLGRLLVDMTREPSLNVRPEDAYKAFEKALEIDPNNAYFYADAGNAALTFGDRERTRRWASICVEKYPQFGQPISQLGYLALREADALSGTGQVETATAKFREAASLLKRSVEANWYGDESSRAVAASNLAAALIRAGDYPESLKAAEDAVALMPRYIDAQFNLAKACELTGNVDRAHAEYVRGLGIQLTHDLSRRSLKTLRKRLQEAGRPLPPISAAIQKALDETQ